MKSFKIMTQVLILLILFISCRENILDQSPKNKYSDKTVWSDINLANAFLKKTYREIPSGFGGAMLCAVTDECYDKHVRGYTNGVLSPDDVSQWTGTGYTDFGRVSWWNYNNIQRLNVFLANIDNVPKAYNETERKNIKKRVSKMKGEALFLRAFAYSQMLRSYGGLPIITKPNKLIDDFSQIKRSSFKETVNFIVQQCNKAGKLLKLKKNMELGRATKEAALALESRVLLFAASDLTADGTAENKYVGYLNPNRRSLWKKARDAAKGLIDLGTAQLADFGAPDQKAVAKNYYEFFKAKDLSNKEIIWGKMFDKNQGETQHMNLWNGPNGLHNWSSDNVTQNFVDDYEMKDGSEFSDHFKRNSDGYYQNVSNTLKGNIYDNREPRFYASILYDGAKFQPRIGNLKDIDPIGIYERRTHKVIHEDGSITKRYGLDTRNGPVQSWSGSFTGYIFKKWLDDQVIGQNEANTNAWIELRYAEILLNYAESSLELGNRNKAAKYINMIRNRAGLSDFTGDITKALRYEWKTEFAFENKRWYNIRRWKILKPTLSEDVYGIRIVETVNKKKGTHTITWQRVKKFKRGPISKKLYWLPISSKEMNKAPQLVQNPSY